MFTLTETTDASGSTAKPGASPRTVTTDANGAAHLLDGVIGATGDRWFRLAETKAPASYALPSAGTYWMVRVSGGADKASVTVSGSNAEAKALLKGLDGSTVTVGDRLEGHVVASAHDRRTLRRGPRGRAGRRGHARPARRRVRGLAPQERVASR